MSTLTRDDGDRALITCPVCRQTARVDRRGGRLSVNCFAECQESDVLESLGDVGRGRILEELGAPADANGNGRPRSRRRVVLTAASTITPEPLRWLWRHRLPLRGLSLIAGEPGLGKSTLTVEISADVTRGRLDGDLHGEARDVLVATAEDHFASVVWGRLTAAGADMSRVHRVHVEDRDGEELLTLPDDVAEIEARCEELAASGRPVALVVVDPVAAFIGVGVDTHRDAAIRRVLAPLAGLAERQELTAVGVAHLNKDTAGKLLSRVGGSVAFGAAPRSVLAFARHPDDPDGDQGVERVIVHAKSNHGRYAPSLAARIEAREVETVGEVSRLVISGECEVGPDDLGTQPGGDHHDRDAAGEWLADELADGQWHESREVKARAKATGHSERTLKRAKQTLGIEDRREGFPAGLRVAPASWANPQSGQWPNWRWPNCANPHSRAKRDRSAAQLGHVPGWWPNCGRADARHRRRGGRARAHPGQVRGPRRRRAVSDKLLTAEEVAEIVGMTPDYIYTLSRRGRIPTITFGRQRRYRRESIDQWLSELERGSLAADHRNGRAAR